MGTSGSRFLPVKGREKEMLSFNMQTYFARIIKVRFEKVKRVVTTYANGKFAHYFPVFFLLKIN